MVSEKRKGKGEKEQEKRWTVSEGMLRQMDTKMVNEKRNRKEK